MIYEQCLKNIKNSKKKNKNIIYIQYIGTYNGINQYKIEKKTFDRETNEQEKFIDNNQIIEPYANIIP